MSWKSLNVRPLDLDASDSRRTSRPARPAKKVLARAPLARAMLAALAAHLAANADETNGSRPLARRRRLRIDGPPDGNPSRTMPEFNLRKMRSMFRADKNISHGQRSSANDLSPESARRVAVYAIGG